jgi:hypothetical protein
VPGECLNRFRCKALVFMDIEQVNEGRVHELNGNAETRSVEVGPREFRQIVFRWGIQDVSRSFEGPVFGEGEGKRAEESHFSALSPWGSRLSVSGTPER